MSDTIEVKKTVPVVADVDVLIAGGGIAGSTAALTAARNGAKTMLVERFGCLGGNMGPGMFSGGVLHLAVGYPMAMLDGLKGIPGEFVNRCEGYCDGQLGHDYFRDSQVVSYVWFKLMEENGVQLMLNTYVADPIMEGKRVKGIIVENKSGTQAIRAKVVIDATGDADVATRTGAPVDAGENSTPGMYFAIGNVDQEKYLSFLAEESEPNPEDLRWAEDLFKKEFGGSVPSLNKLIPFYKRAWESGEYRIIKRIDDLASVTVDHGLYPPKHGIVGAQVGLRGKRILSGDAAIMTKLEVKSRMYIFETAQFLRRHMPGFENSYLHMIAPYFHARVGRSIVSECTLTMDENEEGRRFDDVIFVIYRDLFNESHWEETGGRDFPYRQLLPKGVEGLLVTGRAAIISGFMRARWKIFLQSQAAGLAAAMAAKANVTPREVNVKELQRLLYHKYHAPLGDKNRLQELGLI